MPDMQIILPKNDTERAAFETELNLAMQAAKESVFSMSHDYRLMSTFRELAGVPQTNDVWPDGNERGIQTLFAAYALCDQYVSEATASLRQIGKLTATGGQDDIAVAGRPDELSVRGDHERIELVQGAGATSGEGGATASHVDGLEKSGIVGVAPWIILAAGVVVTAAAVWTVSELCEVMKKSIARAQQRDLEDMPIRLQQAGYTPDQAAKITSDTLAQAQKLVATQNEQKSGTENLTDTVKTVLWGGAALVLIGGAAYIGFPFLRSLVEERTRRTAAAAA